MLLWEVSSFADGKRGDADGAADAGNRTSALIVALLVRRPQLLIATVRVADGYPLLDLAARKSKSKQRDSREEANRTVAEHGLSCLPEL